MNVNNINSYIELKNTFYFVYIKLPLKLIEDFIDVNKTLSKKDIEDHIIVKECIIKSYNIVDNIYNIQVEFFNYDTIGYESLYLKPSQLFYYEKDALSLKNEYVGKIYSRKFIKNIKTI